MGRKSIKESRQKEIIEIFYRVAKKEGLENTSIAKIAKEMDINPSLIIHYFQTKEDLTKGLVDYILDKYLLIYQVNPSKKMTALVRLEAIIGNLFSTKWNRLVDDGLFYSCYALTFRDAEVKELYKALHDKLRASLAAFIQQCIDEREINVADADLAAQLIFVIVDGSYYYLSLVSDKAEYNQKQDIYKQQAYRVLGI